MSQLPEDSLLRLFNIAYDGAGGPDSQRQVRTAVAIEGGGSEMVKQGLARYIRVEPVIIDAGDGITRSQAA